MQSEPADALLAFLKMEPFGQQPLHHHHLQPPAATNAQQEPLPDHSFESDGGDAWTTMVLPYLQQKAPTEPPLDQCILDSESDDGGEDEKSETDSLL